MEKTATLNIRVNPEDKKAAEAVLEQLGIPVSTAVTMFLKKVAMTGGIPFAMRLPEVPSAVDASRMTPEEFHRDMEIAYQQYLNGETVGIEELRKEIAEWAS